MKQQKESVQEEENAWSSFSLSMATRDMEAEDTVYNEEDLKVVFSRKLPQKHAGTEERNSETL
jgi:hypothetical protein